ncbi:2-dehydropantoate 2-reductase [Paenibacillus sp. LMG 31456]|uniref:2-dehydropantoate 2-reductase n=1 Tax=Paenibacillus foliorum TaxID=2654974 RepID=A0A972K3Y7_9BACL|nr:2-dehydropantoate 2-reductase [Paenibacillus foliorum]NOU95422.1 2-dehydropantoate 2-reductase [Paenibacillus foliorum]
MKIRVVGAGAMGMLLASRLISAGANVELVTRTIGQAQLIREQGLLFTAGAESVNNSNKDIFKVTPVVLCFEEAAASAEAVKETAELPDMILLMLKQTSITEELAAAMKVQLRKPGSKLVCFQNGIGHIELLQRYIPQEQLLVAVTTEGALKHSPHHVEHTGRGMTWIGDDKSGIQAINDNTLVKKFKKLMFDAGFTVNLSNNITSKVWNKLLINAVINPITAILQVRNGLLPELPASYVLMRTLFDEGVMLADELDIELAPDLWEQLLDVCRRTANNQSSMLQDVLSKRQTENDAITGGLLARARGTEVVMPTHNTMYHLLRSIEQQWETI